MKISWLKEEEGKDFFRGMHFCVNWSSSFGLHPLRLGMWLKDAEDSFGLLFFCRNAEGKRAWRRVEMVVFGGIETFLEVDWIVSGFTLLRLLN